MIDELLPIMHDFYSSLSQKFNFNLDQKIDFFKIVPNADYELWWNEKLNDPDFKPYIGAIKDNLAPVFSAGIIDCNKLKQCFEDFLESQSLLINEIFDFERLTDSQQHLEYKNEAFDKIIFCDGPYAANNPYFKWLPFNLCQGEWIVIKTENEIENKVINAKINIIPLGNCRYKLSSTYSWKNLDWNPSESAKSELLAVFEKHYPVSFEIIDHQAALRPTVADRRPYLGSHPENRNIFIFNGLGSKGVMLAPYFSQMLADHILFGKEINAEVSISRHYKRYYNQA